MTTVSQPTFELPDLKDFSAEEAVKEIISLAVAQHSSDIYLMSEQRAMSAAIRRNGRVYRVGAVPIDIGRNMIAYIKTNAEMDITEKRRPLDGRWLLDDGNIDIRINTIATLHGEDLCMRIWGRNQEKMELDQLGLFESDVAKLKKMLASPSGLILVTGPTGTGKTTTLYSCLRHLNDGSRKINTLEDPIEYAIPGVRQSQVNTKIGVDFPDLLRSVLRQAPDVIMVGEIRDSETAQIAVRAANSGHLVLATLHAPVSTSAVKNMIFFNVSPHFLSDGLLGVVSQRLFRKLCPECKTRIDVGSESNIYEEIETLVDEQQRSCFYSPGSCDACMQEGYHGRDGLFELMEVNSNIRHLIADSANPDLLREAAVEADMIEFQRGAKIKISQGVTSPEEILRVVSPEYLGLDK